MATMRLPGYGYGIRYEYGMFSQRIENGYQVEHPDNWLRYGNPWEFARPEVLFRVKFHGRPVQYVDENGVLQHQWVDTDDVMAMAYDTPIPGYGSNTVNNMRLWSAKATRDFDLTYFNEGDYIRAGEPLMDGAANPHDILKVMGEKALAKYLVDEIHEVYRLQGVTINDKHIETIVRQMLRRVTIKDPGDTNFLIDDKIDKGIFRTENERIISQDGRPATAESLLLGITKAALSTESFISASSFQETTKVLTEAAVAGRVDELTGPKENVIMGRLIPAGTGVAIYQGLAIDVLESAEQAMADLEDEDEFDEAPATTSA